MITFRSLLTALFLTFSSVAGFCQQPISTYQKTTPDNKLSYAQTDKPAKDSIPISTNPYYQFDPEMKIDTTKKSTAYWQDWMKDLEEMGIDKKKDSLFVSREVMHLLRDKTYRNSIYPTPYNWQTTVAFMKQMELKKAFWQMINLYQTDIEHRHIVIGTVCAYDSLMEMDKILLSTFYTYAFADPEVCRITSNKPDIFRPDLLEKKLRTTREIVGYVWENRKRKQPKAK